MKKVIMNSEPKVSVIMLTYNREKMVGHMIECILSQTMEEFEFIIINNGSTDGSQEVIETYAKRDKRIRIVQREGGNIGSARNMGLSLAKGTYVAFVDDDDVCEKDFLEFLYQLITNEEADISICGATWSEHDEKYVMNAEEAMERLLWRKNYNVAFPTKMFKRILFDNNRFPEHGKYDDIYLMPKMIAEANRIVYHGLSKYDFIRHESNNSIWTQKHYLLDVETLKEYLEVYDERTKWLNKLFPQSMQKWNYFNWSFMISMVEKISRYNLEECLEIKNQLIKTLNCHKQTFCQCPWILEEEKEWMNQYVID